MCRDSAICSLYQVNVWLYFDCYIAILQRSTFDFKNFSWCIYDLGPRPYEESANFIYSVMGGPGMKSLRTSELDDYILSVKLFYLIVFLYLGVDIASSWLQNMRKQQASWKKMIHRWYWLRLMPLWKVTWLLGAPLTFFRMKIYFIVNF